MAAGRVHGRSYAREMKENGCVYRSEVEGLTLAVEPVPRPMRAPG